MKNHETEKEWLELYVELEKIVEASGDREAHDMKEVISGWTRKDEPLQRATEEESGHAFTIHRSFP